MYRFINYAFFPFAEILLYYKLHNKKFCLSECMIDLIKFNKKKLRLSTSFELQETISRIKTCVSTFEKNRMQTHKKMQIFSECVKGPACDITPVNKVFVEKLIL